MVNPLLGVGVQLGVGVDEGGVELGVGYELLGLKLGLEDGVRETEVGDSLGVSFGNTGAAEVSVGSPVAV